MQATLLWFLWQSLLASFQPAFTHRGWQRFGQWTTGIVLNVEEHTITQSLIALDCPDDWKALEYFAELGTWNQDILAQCFAQLLDTAPGSLWHGYRVSAVDDTKVHRNSKNVWGTCTFHEYTARCPNRATTVRAHNWVLFGRLLEYPDHPAWFLPHTGRLYFRRSQLPIEPVVEVFHTKCELAVELMQEHAQNVPGPHLAVFDGGYAFASVVRPLVQPPEGKPRIDFLTRLRIDARLYALPTPPKLREGAKKQRGRPAKWGKRLPPPRQGGLWPGEWQEGTAFIYGRKRHVRWKEVICQWRVLGYEIPVKAVVAEVEGYKDRFCLVSSALSLTGLQMVELFAARFRQEDGIRDLKQRLGWEECRAWTKLPIERTTQVLFCALSLMRMLQFRLDEREESDWWQAPPWNRHKERPSVLDVERMFRRHAEQIKQHLSAWLTDGEKDAG
jgi:hypothetical protein